MQKCTRHSRPPLPSFPRKRESQLSQNQPISKNTFIANLILYGIFILELWFD